MVGSTRTGRRNLRRAIAQQTVAAGYRGGLGILDGPVAFDPTPLVHRAWQTGRWLAAGLVVAALLGSLL